MIYTNVTLIEFLVHPKYWIWDNIIEFYDLSFVEKNGGVIVHVAEDLLNLIEDEEQMEILVEQHMIVETNDEGQVFIYDSIGPGN